MAFRIKFLEEELQEFKDAYAEGDHAGMFDALLDLVYVAHGTAHLQGYPWVQGWALVQAANMAKVRAQPDGSNSKRGSGWDVVKPEGWTAPDIAQLLTEYGWEHAPEALQDPLQQSEDDQGSAEDSGLSSRV